MPRQAFTKLELLIVIGLAAIVVGAAIPLIYLNREASLRMQTIRSLKELAAACHSYEDQHKRLPPVHTGANTLHVLLAPYYGYDSSILVSPADYSIASRQTAFVRDLVDKDVAQEPSPMTSFSANYYVFGNHSNATEEDLSVTLPQPGHPFGYTPLSTFTIRDGSSNTLIFTTCLAEWGEDRATVVSGPRSLPNQPSSPITASMTWIDTPHPARYVPRVNARAEGYRRHWTQLALADGSGRSLRFDDKPHRCDGSGQLPVTRYRQYMLPNDGLLPCWCY